MVSRRELCAPKTAAIEFRGHAHRSAKQWRSTTHRACPPEQTFERIQPLLARAGVTRVADITGLDRIGVTVVSAQRPNARSLAAAAGKGFDRIAATVSACMEAIELHHAEHAELPVELGSLRAMAARGPVVAADRLPLVRDSVYTDDVVLPWTIGFDLVAQAETRLPLELVCLPNQEVPALRMGGQLFQAGSNGLASGNSFLEALCAGLYEVIERDAHALAQLADRQLGRTAPRVDAINSPYPLVRDLAERLDAAGQLLVVCDVTSDVDVPCHTATILDRHERNVGAHAGYGSHLDPQISMVRAITEAVQGRAIYISGSRDDLYVSEFRRWKRGDLASNVRRFLEAPAPIAPERADCSGASFEADVATLLARLSAVGCDEVVVVDLTDPSFGVPVVKVVVPGLEGYADFANYAPGPRGAALLAA
ncbi:MAG: YcaO-like family protein [Actinomycetota bacterium]|nr:YcaO-like family protein [Actinomycetota bacterium]